jgi:hypothetical protein
MVSTSQQPPLLQQERRPAFLSRAQLIERIMQLNPTATPEFLARFSEAALAHYLEHLSVMDEPTVPWIRRGISPAIVRREASE